jgi:DNA adenine methylase
MHSVLERIPEELINYHEPFLGGGSVLLAVLARKRPSGSIYASDANKRLIQLYRHVQSNLDEFLNECETLLREYERCPVQNGQRNATSRIEAMTSTESYYYWLRSEYNQLCREGYDTIRVSVLFLFLNKTCFRGVYRENRHGGFNVPYGHYKEHSFYDEAILRSVSALIQGVVFQHQPFEVSLARIGQDDFVYMDPPYVPENATSFVGYNADGFSAESHKKLFDICKGLSCRFLLSNSDVTLLHTTFPEPYIVERIPVRRAINSVRPGATTCEVLIRN